MRIETKVLYVGAMEVDGLGPYLENGWQIAHVRESWSDYETTRSVVVQWLFVLERTIE